jgi:hypothetical protein
MSDVINKPTFGSAELPFPDVATIDPIWISSDHNTLGGKTRRDIMARKYQYTLQWKYMKVNAYNSIEGMVNTFTPQTFTYEKWPQSESGVTCIGKLSERKLEVGVGDTYYYSSVTLTLIEEDTRL